MYEPSFSLKYSKYSPNQVALEHKLVVIILLIFIKLIRDAQQNLLDQQSGYFILRIFDVCLDACYVHFSE
jgi:hypothetical protein